MTSIGLPAGAAVAPGRFSALAVRDFRRLWFSTVSLGSGQQIEVLVLGWYVLLTTDSPRLVGLVGAARWGGMLLAPFSGVLADRVPRRTLLIIVQVMALISSLTVGLLALADLLTTPLLVAAVLLGGVARAFDQTIRQTLIGDLVSRDRLTSAVAMVQIAMNGSAILAPLAAGRLFGVAGVGGCYVVMSLLILYAISATSLLRPTPVAPVNTAISPLRSLLDGIAYVRRTPVVASLLLIAAVANLCPFPLTFAMMPSFARDVLGVGAGGLSVLLAGAGVGALAGNLVMSGFGNIRRRGPLVIGAMLAWMLTLALFSFSRWFPLSVALLVLFGACQAVSMSMVAVLLLNITPAELRGRVISVRMFAIATLPLGAVIAGELIQRFGAPSTALVFAAGGSLLTVIVAVLAPDLLRRH